MPELKTRRQWRKQFRRVQAGERPVAYYSHQYTFQHTITTVHFDGTETTKNTPEQKERQIPLYSEAQTKPYRRVGAQILRDVYCRYFVDSAQRDCYIWQYDGRWLFCRNYLDDHMIRQHLQGKEIYGILGGKNTCFSAIDADYHGGDYEVFREQLTAVVEALHGKDGWHYSFGPRGCHLLQTHRKTPLQTARNRLRYLLQTIDDQHPELRERALAANMKTIADWEVYPDPKRGFRLPLATGRTVFLDEPCRDLKSYIQWQIRPSYRPVEEVLEAIFSVIQPLPETPTPQKTSKKPQKHQPSPKTERVFGSLRGRYAQVLVDFWTGKHNPPDSLNCAILLTARMMPFYYSESQDASDFMETLIDDLPDVGFSDRLSAGNRKEISRMIRKAVEAAYGENGHQSNPELSTGKLSKTFSVWQSRNFSLIDRSTWDRISASATLGNDFSFTIEEMEQVARLARILRADLQTTANATRHLLRLLAGRRSCQLSIRYVRRFLTSFGIRCGHHGRVNEYLKTLWRLEWITLVAGYVLGRRGRLWEVGEKMQGKFVVAPSKPVPRSRAAGRGVDRSAWSQSAVWRRSLQKVLRSTLSPTKNLYGSTICVPTLGHQEKNPVRKSPEPSRIGHQEDLHPP